ncbi:MAG: ATP-binding protein [Candidatus Aenigmatarchaeota archaeon]
MLGKNIDHEKKLKVERFFSIFNFFNVQIFINLDTERICSSYLLSFLIIFLMTFLLHFLGGSDNPVLAFSYYPIIIISVLSSFPAFPYPFLFSLAFLYLGLAMIEYAGIISIPNLGGMGLNSSQRLAFAIGNTAGFFLVAYGSKRIISHIFEKKGEYLMRDPQISLKLNKINRLVNMGHISASILHEIKNPLTAIMLQTKIIESGVKDYELKAGCNLIIQEVERIGEIVRNFLQLGKENHSQKRFTDINRLLEKSLLISRNYISRFRDIEVKIIAERVLPEIPVEENSLIHVFLNLINNAVSAMPEGGVLEIRTSRVIRGSSEYVEISFKDTGCGIPQEIKERIFEPFFTTKRPEEGTGLGLFISKQIVERHKGLIEVESYGKGTTMKILLPVR